MPKINLDPQKRPKQVLTVHHQGPFANRKRDYANLSRKSSVSSSEPSMSSASSPVKEVQAKVPSPVHQVVKSEVTVILNVHLQIHYLWLWKLRYVLLLLLLLLGHCCIYSMRSKISKCSIMGLFLIHELRNDLKGSSNVSNV